MDINQLAFVDALPGRKRLMLGNHDRFATDVYRARFRDGLYGTVKKYGFWISHVPVHPLELRGFPNVHGHCHHHPLRDDPRYLNVAIEWLPDHRPMSLDEIRNAFKERGVTHA